MRRYSGMSSPDEALAAPLWDEHKQAEFPARLRGEDVAGVDMVMLDADVAGCVDTLMRSQGQLDSRRKDVLAKCLADLNRVLPLLDDDGERRYSERLQELAALALRGRPGET